MLLAQYIVLMSYDVYVRAQFWSAEFFFSLLFTPASTRCEWLEWRYMIRIGGVYITYEFIK